MAEQAKCSLCGEPMPPGEEMFKYHGYSGPCPKPPIQKAPKETVEARLARAEAVLRACLVYEEKVAGYAGLRGCTCINADRDSERDYETGRCPHQQARRYFAE